MAPEKITKLTPEQEEQLQAFREEYLQVGLCTEPAQRKKAVAAITQMYKILDRKKPKFVWVNSPLIGCATISYLKAGKELTTAQKKQLVNKPYKELLEGLFKDTKVNYTGTNFWGQFDCYWIAFYMFPAKYLGVKYDDEHMKVLELWDKIARSCCWWWAFEDVVIVSDRPEEIHRKDGQLHRDGGPSIRFRDGWSRWHLNGVRVPQWLAEAQDHQLEAKQIFEEECKNAEVRREFVRKFGILRLKEYAIKVDGATYEAKDHEGNMREVEYELYDFKPLMPNEAYAPYLIFENATMKGIWHAEGINPDCHTVADAMKMRNRDGDQPVILT